MNQATPAKHTHTAGTGHLHLYGCQSADSHDAYVYRKGHTVNQSSSRVSDSL